MHVLPCVVHTHTTYSKYKATHKESTTWVWATCVSKVTMYKKKLEIRKK